MPHRERENVHVPVHEDGRAAAVARAVGAAGGVADASTGDVTDESSVDRLVSQVASRLG